MSGTIAQKDRTTQDHTAQIAKQTAGILIECDGKILMARRALTKKYQPGKWNFVGGAVEPGETLQQAAARECREEAGIIIDEGQLTPIGIVRYTEFTTPAEFHLYHVDLSSRPPVVLNRESMDYGWFSVGEAKRLDLIAGEDESLIFYERYKKRRKIGHARVKKDEKAQFAPGKPNNNL